MPSSRPVYRAVAQFAWSRRGVTLIELLVALVVLGGMVALVAPALTVPTPHDVGLTGVVRSARSAAIARAQPLALTVAASGDWSVRPLPPDDALVVAEGRLDRPLARSLRLQLSPLGACVPLTPLPAALVGWDAASCTAAPAMRPRGA
ncbi:MAG: prepilin-type N-terminal cleavage/methylation domain-containing protein [Gemmatimonadota bacterium]